MLISHAHRDHLDLPSLNGRCPARRGSWSRPAWAPSVAAPDCITSRRLTPANTWTFGRGSVLPFPALHDGNRPPLGPRAAALGFVIAGSSTVYFAGDTDLFPEMERLRGETDAALLPVWGWGPSGPRPHEPRRAAEAAAMIGARVTVPIHWGGLFPEGFHKRLAAPARGAATRVPRYAHRIGAPTDVRILEPGGIRQRRPSA